VQFAPVYMVTNIVSSALLSSFHCHIPRLQEQLTRATGSIAKRLVTSDRRASAGTIKVLADVAIPKDWVRKNELRTAGACILVANRDEGTALTSVEARRCSGAESCQESEGEGADGELHFNLGLEADSKNCDTIEDSEI
jgi:hypothetical protein